MVTQASPRDERSSPLIKSTAVRKASAIGMIILLYTAATPFNPVAWLTSELEGAFFLDRLLAGVLLFAAMYFQWRIASQLYPVAICLPTGGMNIRDGNITQGGGDLVFLYRPTEYWKYFAAEAVMLGIAEFGGVEFVRRGLVGSAVLLLWTLGWFVTPERIKKEAWEHIKRIWFWIAVDEIMRIGSRGYGGRRRRW